MKNTAFPTLVPSRFPSSRNRRNPEAEISAPNGVPAPLLKHPECVANALLTPQAVVVLFGDPTRYGDAGLVGGGVFAGQGCGETIREMSILWSQRIEGGRLPGCP